MDTKHFELALSRFKKGDRLKILRVDYGKVIAYLDDYAGMSLVEKSSSSKGLVFPKPYSS